MELGLSGGYKSMMSQRLEVVINSRMVTLEVRLGACSLLRVRVLDEVVARWPVLCTDLRFGLDSVRHWPLTVTVQFRSFRLLSVCTFLSRPPHVSHVCRWKEKTERDGEIRYRV